MSDSAIKCIEITAQCTVGNSKYGYIPSLPSNAAFLAIFGSLAIIHAYLGIKTETWFFGAMMAIGSMTEAIGYVGRVIMYNNVYSISGSVYIQRLP
jgi:hypothetical protein